MAIGAVRSNLLSHDPDKLREGIRFRSKNTRAETGKNTITGKDKYILDADIKGFFDNINHDWIMENVFLPKELKMFILA